MPPRSPSPAAPTASCSDDTWIPAAPAPAIVDATGAGDVLAGTVAARLAHHASLADAVRAGVAAAARSLGARGGTGWLTAHGLSTRGVPELE